VSEACGVWEGVVLRETRGDIDAGATGSVEDNEVSALVLSDEYAVATLAGDASAA
jgi:hypothetical protein